MPCGHAMPFMMKKPESASKDKALCSYAVASVVGVFVLFLFGVFEEGSLLQSKLAATPDGCEQQAPKALLLSHREIEDLKAANHAQGKRIVELAAKLAAAEARAGSIPTAVAGKVLLAPGDVVPAAARVQAKPSAPTTQPPSGDGAAAKVFFSRCDSIKYPPDKYGGFRGWECDGICYGDPKAINTCTALHNLCLLPPTACDCKPDEILDKAAYKDCSGTVRASLEIRMPFVCTAETRRGPECKKNGKFSDDLASALGGKRATLVRTHRTAHNTTRTLCKAGTRARLSVHQRI